MLTKIISGGQTGADQAGLAAACAIGLETGGWMPKGWRTEDGPRPDLGVTFGLREHTSASFPPRTIQNVIDSDGTVWVGTTTSPGYHCTRNAALVRRKPFLANPTVLGLRAWVAVHDIRTLNVAGNRESTNRGVGDRTYGLLTEAFDTE